MNNLFPGKDVEDCIFFLTKERRENELNLWLTNYEKEDQKKSTRLIYFILFFI
jgi:hypothetical protein